MNITKLLKMKQFEEEKNEIDGQIYGVNQSIFERVLHTQSQEMCQWADHLIGCSFFCTSNFYIRSKSQKLPTS